MCGTNRKRDLPRRLGTTFRAAALSALLLGPSAHLLQSQTAQQESLQLQLKTLTEAMARAQAQVEESQRQLEELRKQLTALQQQMAQSGTVTAPAANAAPASPAASMEDLQERQAMQQAQIATHEQTKVESESKYPVKITGLLLFNSFVNTSAVDAGATPTLAVPGPGSTGASVRQTVLGIDARGPHLFGAGSYADLRIDFAGNPGAAYFGYYSTNDTLLRLRTAHAGLRWKQTEAYFSLDRPIFSPDSPTSLTALAEPALAWSGNLWTWNPQLGVTRDFGLTAARDLRLQAALVDVGDAPLYSSSNPASGSPASASELSRWPGVEARVALLGSRPDERANHIGLGGYFSPHRSSLGYSYDAWAATLDGRLHLPARLEASGSFYRGLGLGGLGGGGYKDFVYGPDGDGDRYYFRALNDVGGWAQLKEKLTERLEFNGAFGLDNVFAADLRGYAVPGGSIYQNLARNHTYTANVIYSPSAYLLFSLEYRHLESFPITGLPASSNVIGLGAGYKF